MRERADGNEIYAAARNRADSAETHAAAGLGFRAAFGDFYRLSQLHGRHVVQQDDVRARVSGLRNLFERVGLDFHLQPGKFLARLLNRGGHSIRFFILQRGEMVVFDENHVEQSDTMIFSPAASDGIFFKPPPAGRRLARVENLRPRAADGNHELRGERGDAGKVLHKIQRDSLGGQNRAGGTGNAQQIVATRNVGAVVNQIFNFYRRRKAAKGGLGEIEAGDDERFARAHDGFERQAFRHGGARRHVAAADVLGQRAFDGGADF